MPLMHTRPKFPWLGTFEYRGPEDLGDLITWLGANCPPVIPNADGSLSLRFHRRPVTLSKGDWLVHEQEDPPRFGVVVRPDQSDFETRALHGHIAQTFNPAIVPGRAPENTAPYDVGAETETK